MEEVWVVDNLESSLGDEIRLFYAAKIAQSYSSAAKIYVTARYRKVTVDSKREKTRQMWNSVAFALWATYH
ncbi:hypothetical protein ACTXT7_013919 [Hymenolepis weldensis]